MGWKPSFLLRPLMRKLQHSDNEWSVRSRNGHFWKLSEKMQQWLFGRDSTKEIRSLKLLNLWRRRKRRCLMKQLTLSFLSTRSFSLSHSLGRQGRIERTNPAWLTVSIGLMTFLTEKTKFEFLKGNVKHLCSKIKATQFVIFIRNLLLRAISR
jgi:hypothetical protein